MRIGWISRTRLRRLLTLAVCALLALTVVLAGSVTANAVSGGTADPVPGAGSRILPRLLNPQVLQVPQHGRGYVVYALFDARNGNFLKWGITHVFDDGKDVVRYPSGMLDASVPAYRDVAGRLINPKIPAETPVSMRFAAVGLTKRQAENLEFALRAPYGGPANNEGYTDAAGGRARELVTSIHDAGYYAIKDGFAKWIENGGIGQALNVLLDRRTGPRKGEAHTTWDDIKNNVLPNVLSSVPALPPGVPGGRPLGGRAPYLSDAEVLALTGIDLGAQSPPNAGHGQSRPQPGAPGGPREDATPIENGTFELGNLAIDGSGRTVNRARLLGKLPEGNVPLTRGEWNFLLRLVDRQLVSAVLGRDPGSAGEPLPEYGIVYKAGTGPGKFGTVQVVKGGTSLDTPAGVRVLLHTQSQARPSAGDILALRRTPYLNEYLLAYPASGPPRLVIYDRFGHFANVQVDPRSREPQITRAADLNAPYSKAWYDGHVAAAGAAERLKFAQRLLTQAIGQLTDMATRRAPGAPGARPRPSTVTATISAALAMAASNGLGNAGHIARLRQTFPTGSALTPANRAVLSGVLKDALSAAKAAEQAQAAGADVLITGPDQASDTIGYLTGLLWPQRMPADLPWFIREAISEDRAAMKAGRIPRYSRLFAQDIAGSLQDAAGRLRGTAADKTEAVLRQRDLLASALETELTGTATTGQWRLLEDALQALTGWHDLLTLVLANRGHLPPGTEPPPTGGLPASRPSPGSPPGAPAVAPVPAPEQHTKQTPGAQVSGPAQAHKNDTASLAAAPAPNATALISWLGRVAAKYPASVREVGLELGIDPATMASDSVHALSAEIVAKAAANPGELAQLARGAAEPVPGSELAALETFLKSLQAESDAANQDLASLKKVSQPETLYICKCFPAGTPVATRNNAARKQLDDIGARIDAAQQAAAQLSAHQPDSASRYSTAQLDQISARYQHAISAVDDAIGGASATLDEPLLLPEKAASLPAQANTAGGNGQPPRDTAATSAGQPVDGEVQALPATQAGPDDIFIDATGGATGSPSLEPQSPSDLADLPGAGPVAAVFNVITLALQANSIRSTVQQQGLQGLNPIPKWQTYSTLQNWVSSWPVKASDPIANLNHYDPTTTSNAADLAGVVHIASNTTQGLNDPSLPWSTGDPGVIDSVGTGGEPKYLVAQQLLSSDAAVAAANDPCLTPGNGCTQAQRLAAAQAWQKQVNLATSQVLADAINNYGFDTVSQPTIWQQLGSAGAQLGLPVQGFTDDAAIVAANQLWSDQSQAAQEQALSLAWKQTHPNDPFPAKVTLVQAPSAWDTLTQAASKWLTGASANLVGDAASATANAYTAARDAWQGAVNTWNSTIGRPVPEQAPQNVSSSPVASTNSTPVSECQGGCRALVYQPSQANADTVAQAEPPLIRQGIQVAQQGAQVAQQDIQAAGNAVQDTVSTVNNVQQQAQQAVQGAASIAVQQTQQLAQNVASTATQDAANVASTATQDAANIASTATQDAQNVTSTATQDAQNVASAVSSDAQLVAEGQLQQAAAAAQQQAADAAAAAQQQAQQAAAALSQQAAQLTQDAGSALGQAGSAFQQGVQDVGTALGIGG